MCREIVRLAHFQLNDWLISNENLPRSFGKNNLLLLQAARGKFMDTSHRIFNEQRVQKSHLYYEPTVAVLATSHVNKFTFLEMKVKEKFLSKRIANLIRRKTEGRILDEIVPPIRKPILVE